VESAEDVLAHLGAAPSRRLWGAPDPVADPALHAPAPTDLPERLARLLSPTPIHLDDLSRLLEAGAGTVAAALFELELEGRAASLPGGYAASPSAAFD